jgi:hypothetical protein
MATAGGHNAARMTDTDLMSTGPAASRLRRVLTAPFSRRTWAEFLYLLLSVPLAVAGFALTVATSVPPLLAAVSAPVVRRFGDASRGLARGLLGEDAPGPPPPRAAPLVHVRTPDAARLADLAVAEGARVRQRGSRARISGLTASRVAELASENQIATSEPHQRGGRRNGEARDRAAWRARGYLLLKLPLTVVGLAAAVLCCLSGLFCVAAPFMYTLLSLLTSGAPTMHMCRNGVCKSISLPGKTHAVHSFLISISGLGTWNLSHDPFVVVPFGVALLLAAPWITRAVTEADRSLIRGLLGPAPVDERVRAVQETRARAVDDSAARMRGIERDLHDGTQAQLVGLAMKLGLAKEKLAAAAPADMAHATELVDDAHRGVIEALADLRTLARGIHPPVLDNGLADALATLVARSALPVELVTDIPERPSPAIESIAYFSAAELLTNAAKHGGAGHATLEAVHVPGLLRIRVSDDGGGGARLVPGGGLCGLADRVRTVDGRLNVSSPAGGPTVVTVELPSHA